MLLSSKPLQIRSGEIHYSRVPRDEWSSRIQMAKAMGLNTICTYVFWNLHEQKRGEYDFTGDKDVAAFIKECGAQGMHVIVRPGPYVCAEWDLGGLPAWLLAEPGIKLRSSDPKYLEPAKGWMRKMGSMLQPLSVEQGGPVLMVQVENEFGSFKAPDPNYLDEMQRALREGGYTGKTFTSDGASPDMMRNGSRPDMFKAVNFGGGAKGAFAMQQQAFPGQPRFNAEFWVGWFDQWGYPHHLINAVEKMPDLDWMMRNGASFNLYMFHGGTTRGLWTGGNIEGGYRPSTDCYDYSAPLDESGRPTGNYLSFRSVIQETLKDEKLPDVPKLPPTASLGTITLTEQCRWADTLGEGTPTPVLQTMESLGQITGMIGYRTKVEGPLEGSLDLGQVKDRVYVLLDGAPQGVSGRSTKTGALSLSIPAGSHRLDLLVENMGRVNYAKVMNDERKGLTGPVMFGDKELGPFTQVGLPLQSPPTAKYEEIPEGKTLGAGVLYRGKLPVSVPRDTFLDLRGFGRGMVWVNGRNLGRYWNVGPIRTIFLPGCWLKPDQENEVVVLELESTKVPVRLPTSKEAIWGN